MCNVTWGDQGSQIERTKIDLENKMGGKLQKWICGHVQTFIKMFKRPCYKNGGDMQ